MPYRPPVLAARIVAVAVLAAWAGFGLAAQQPAPLTTSDPFVTRADALLDQRRYEDAYVAYRAVRESADPETRIRAGAGMVRILLRLSLFVEAERQGAALATGEPGAAAALAVHGDALWALGRFDEAERRYDAALTLRAEDPVALHGRGRALAARRQLDPALEWTRRAIAADDTHAPFYYTLAAIHEARHEYADAAATLDIYRRRLPPSEGELARWAEAQAAFLRGFGTRTPNEIVSLDEVYTVPFRIEDDRVLVRGRLNGRTDVDFALDTGTDRTTIPPAMASRAGVVPMQTLQTAGVGSVGIGYRGLQVARLDRLDIGGLQVHQVGCLIKSPVMTGLPRPEGAGFSPLALGLSIEVDYGRQVLTMARTLPAGDYPIRLPLRLQRLATVRGVLNGTTPVSFVIDTGGTAVSLSRSVARRLDVAPGTRLVPARVFGISGWDPTAFLLPYVDIELAPGVGSSQRSVVVLNLDAPSALLGFELGGIIGHEFLSRYVVAIDLVRGELGLRPLS